MAIYSISSTLPLLHLCNSSVSVKPKSSVFALPSNVLKLQTLKSTHSYRVFAAPELLESEETIESSPENLDGPGLDTFEVGGSESPGSSRITIGADVGKDSLHDEYILRRKRIVFEGMSQSVYQCDSRGYQKVDGRVDVYVHFFRRADLKSLRVTSRMVVW